MTEIIMLCGIPGSGKTHVAKQELASADLRLSRDELGGRVIDLVPKMEAAISQGAKKIVLDCTFVLREHRDPFVQAAQRLKVPIHCWAFDVNKEVIPFNICWRMVERYGKVLRTKEDYTLHAKDPNMFPPGVMYGLLKKYERPDISEGFASIKKVAVKRWKLPERFKNSAVMFDYDGTLRDTRSGDKYPVSPKDVAAFPAAIAKVKKLASEGTLLLGASNQSGVAKNNPPMGVCHDCFRETNRQLGVDIKYDFDYSAAGPITSWHRKPLIGMGVDAIWKYELDPSKVTFVGDATTDKTFAKNCGFNFVWAKDYF